MLLVAARMGNECSGSVLTWNQGGRSRARLLEQPDRSPSPRELYLIVSAHVHPWGDLGTLRTIGQVYSRSVRWQWLC